MKKQFSIFILSSVLCLSAGLGVANSQPASTTNIQSAQETNASRALVRLDELETHIRALTDKIERLEAKLESQNEENKRLAKIIDENNAKSLKSQEVIATEVAAIAPVNVSEAKIIQPTIVESTKSTTKAIAVPTNASPPPTAATNVKKADAPKPQIAPVAKPIVVAAAPVIKPNITKPTLSAGQYLNNARLDIQNSDYLKAGENLKTLITNYPEGTEALEARWLLGETYFVQQDWLSATRTYIEYLNKDKNAPRVPDILVRLATTYREMGVLDQRCKAIKAYKSLAINPSPVLKLRAEDEFAKGTCP